MHALGLSVHRRVAAYKRASASALGASASLIAILSLVAAHPAHAEETAPNATIGDLQRELEAQRTALDRQQTLLDDARAQIARQQSAMNVAAIELQRLKGAQSDGELAIVTGRGVAQAEVATAAEPPPQTISVAGGQPPGPVGEAPAPREVSEAVLPQGVNVLTRPGHFVFDSSVNYVQSSNNLLVFRGVEIVPGVEIGLIDASNTSRNQTAVMETVRYGIAPRLEIEALVPYIYGNDRVTEVEQRDQQVSETRFLRGSGLGDVEFTGRYQITSGRDAAPVVVGNLRVKPPTGRGPFDLSYDQFGAALNLPNGSGFWAVEPSVSVLATSDPAVIFASLGYLYSFQTDVNKMIGGALVGRVRPGAAIDASFGFAFSLNQRFSFSLGFKDSYIFRTREYLNDVLEKSTDLQVGSLLLGMSYRLSNRVTVASNLEFGVTSDAPNLSATFHIPLNF